MGKASQRKRERREHGGTLEERAAAARAEAKRPFPVFWTVIGLIVVGGIAALVISSVSSGNETASQKAAAKARVFSVITTKGDNLTTHAADGTDSAVGKQVPTITGTGFDDVKRTISPDSGKAQVILVVAHWCPHCQREVPRIVKWAKEGKLPDSVQVTTIATASSTSRPNYPPAAWLDRENWPFDTIADDEAGTAADALGLDGYPFIVFVKADGTVAKRTSGELPIEDFDKDVQALVAT
jgi:cytochrome c biogenesis protein CcmG/thiol:disulfide interchange protein DsbE